MAPSPASASRRQLLQQPLTTRNCCSTSRRSRTSTWKSGTSEPAGERTLSGEQCFESSAWRGTWGVTLDSRVLRQVGSRWPDNAAKIMVEVDATCQGQASADSPSWDSSSPSQTRFAKGARGIGQVLPSLHVHSPSGLCRCLPSTIARWPQTHQGKERVCGKHFSGRGEWQLSHTAKTAAPCPVFPYPGLCVSSTIVVKPPPPNHVSELHSLNSQLTCG